MGTAVEDRERRDAKKKTRSDIYLGETPFIFYVLFDRVYDGVGTPTSTLRVRGWCVNADTDEGWRSLIGKFLQAREEEHLKPPEGKRVQKRHNLQLHPPIGWDNSTVVNKLGNLDMTKALVLDVRFEDPPAGEKINAGWEVARLDVPPDFDSGCLLGAYVPGTNPSRLEDGLEGWTQTAYPVEPVSRVVASAGGSPRSGARRTPATLRMRGVPRGQCTQDRRWQARPGRRTPREAVR
jgi:hypothetical protein